MLWDIIRDFFVVHIFGGTDSNFGVYNPMLFNNDNDGDFYTNTVYIKLFQDLDGSPLYWSVGDYLSTVATIITMVVILLLCCALIKKIYNMCAHIIG